MTALAAAMAARRDLGGRAWCHRGRALLKACPSLRSPLALAWRLQRGALAGWAAALLVAGVVDGAAAKGVGSLLGSGTQVRTALARLGGQAGITSAYLAAVMGIIGVVAAAYATAAVLRLRTEESAQRAEPVLVTSAGRVRWAASHLIIAVAGTAVVLAAAGFGAGLGVRTAARGRSRHAGAQAARCRAGPAALRRALAVPAVAVALFGSSCRDPCVVGWLPRSRCALAAVARRARPRLRLARWLQDISPFTHVPKLPGGPVTARPAGLAGCSDRAVALAAAGLASCAAATSADSAHSMAPRRLPAPAGLRSRSSLCAANAQPRTLAIRRASRLRPLRTADPVQIA